MDYVCKCKKVYTLPDTQKIVCPNCKYVTSLEGFGIKIKKLIYLKGELKHIFKLWFNSAIVLGWYFITKPLAVLIVSIIPISWGLNLKVSELRLYLLNFLIFLIFLIFIPDIIRFLKLVIIRLFTFNKVGNNSTPIIIEYKKNGNKLTIPFTQEINKNVDKYKLALILRSFRNDDVIIDFEPEKSTSFQVDYYFENEIVEILKDFNYTPYKIGSADSKFKHKANIIKASDELWFEAFRLMSHKADHIIFLLDNTSSLESELSYLIEHNLNKKVLFLLPPNWGKLDHIKYNSLFKKLNFYIQPSKNNEPLAIKLQQDGAILIMVYNNFFRKGAKISGYYNALKQILE